jgi:hypothetical protein
MFYKKGGNWKIWWEGGELVGEELEWQFEIDWSLAATPYVVGKR